MSTARRSAVSRVRAPLSRRLSVIDTASARVTKLPTPVSIRSIVPLVCDVRENAPIHALRIEVDGSEAELSGAKLRDILAVLVLGAGECIQRDKLVEELHAVSATRDSIDEMHTHIRRLRPWLGAHGIPASVVKTVESGYRLNVDRASVDAHRFCELVQQGLSLAPAMPPLAAAILEEALSLWRADALMYSWQGPSTAAAAEQLHQCRTDGP